MRRARTPAPSGTLMPMSALSRPPDRPVFDASFHARFGQLLAWRRDVRRFRGDEVPEALLRSLLDLTALAPSVGNCQPTRWVRVDDAGRRAGIVANFETANRAALATYSGEQAETYARLKLEGLREAPVHLAVFCEDGTPQGHGLGARTMPQTRRYSAVCALHTFWLAARMHGLGVGWISILNPDDIPAILDIPPDWSFIAYLCVGWPREEHLTPELEREGWQARTPHDVVQR
jgi:5,6-dimethylbenzimidazole synthase